MMRFQVNNILWWGVIVFAFLGFLDATYLTVEHFSGSIPPCSLVTGCETVLTSSYSVWRGIPVSLFGALYYMTVFLVAFIWRENSLRFLAGISLFGLAASLWFLYVQAFILHAYCLYCLFSAASSISIFIMIFVLYLFL